MDEGSRYQGEWLKNTKGAEEIQIRPNRAFYEGYWKNGKRNGPVRFVDSDCHQPIHMFHRHAFHNL